MYSYMNPDMGHRVDLHKNVDGFFSELGDTRPGRWRIATAYLAAGGKAATIWCHDPHNNPTPTKCGEMMTNGTDAERNQFLQSHLFVGVYPSVPFPDNDHILQPSSRADKIYQDYGPLFRALHGKRWCTAAHCVSIVNGHHVRVFANAFEMKPFGSGRYSLAVVGGGFSLTATVVAKLRNLPELANGNRSATAKALLPGAGDVPRPCKVSITKEPTYFGAIPFVATIQVPLARGASVVTLQFE